MMTKDFFAGSVADSYDLDCAATSTSDILSPMIDALAKLANASTCLEFAIGTGRVALPLVARGIAVDGIEFSPDMVLQLRRKPGGADLHVVIGDMATTQNGKSYGLVFLVFNTIMNLTTQKAQVACFQNAANHLEQGGKFVVEVMVPELRKYPPGSTAVPFDITKSHMGFDTYQTSEQKLVSHHIYIAADGTARYESLPFRYVWPSELDLMAELAGMKLISRMADWSGTAFTDDSRQHVSVWEKV
jgi:hypothetical protein